MNLSDFEWIAVTRIITILAGVLLLWLGYKLFYLATEKQGEAALHAGQALRLQLSNVAPGVFFAGFGALLLIITLLNPIRSYEREENKDGAKTHLWERDVASSARQQSRPTK